MKSSTMGGSYVEARGMYLYGFFRSVFTPVRLIIELSSKIGGVKLNIIELFYHKVSSPLFERRVLVFLQRYCSQNIFVALGIIVIFIEFKIMQKMLFPQKCEK